MAALGVLLPAAASAVPLDDPHIGGIGFSGPTTGDVASIYWNPAALGLTRGWQITVSGTGSLTSSTVERAPIDPATGQPGGTVDPGTAHANNRNLPLIWPPGPGGFAGLSYDVGGDRFSLGFATYMPYYERTTFGTADGEPVATRYHRIATDFRNLALVPALSIRIVGDLHLGFAPGFLFSTGRLSFAESTCAATGCATAEDPAFDAILDLGSGQGLGSATFAVTLGAGIYYRRRGWEAGVSFSSRPLGEVDGAAVIRGTTSSIIAPGGDPVTCSNAKGNGQGCVSADIVYHLPYVINAAVAWHPRPGLEIATIGRLISFASDDAIDIRLTGTALPTNPTAEHIVLYRGYNTAFDARVRAASWVGEWLRLGAALRAQTSALSVSEVNPGAIDGTTLQPMVMLQARPWKHLWITAGYGYSFMLPVTTNSSVFDPGAAQACADTGGQLMPGATGTDACQARLRGTARPTAAGTYRHSQHDFSLALTAVF